MFIANPSPSRGAALDAFDAALFSDAGAADVARFLALRGGEATPLFALPALAQALGLGVIKVKDEGRRLGLGSFKALGGAYAVAQLTRAAAAKALGRPVAFEELTRAETRAIAETLTFACATDGNHGRSVADGARFVGSRSVVFVHAGVSRARADAIAGFGARIVRVAGNYDDSVAQAAQVAGREGWIVVADTSWPGYEATPGLVMQGYGAIVDEALAQGASPTHVFIQAGVGGVAAAVAARFFARLGAQAPKIIVVEPARAACLLESAAAGAPVKIAEGAPTVMAMLECYEPSHRAFATLARRADAFTSVEDEEAVAAMNRLARPLGSDPAIVSGESGCVGLAGLIAARETLKLGREARILLVNTEGATDPARYRELTGLEADSVAKQGQDA